jgi:hypothetical protein
MMLKLRSERRRSKLDNEMQDRRKVSRHISLSACYS